MHIKKMIEHIVEHGNQADMECLSEMLTTLVYDLKHSDYSKYKMYEYKLHAMAYGEHLTPEMAQHWTEHMENKDGTKGPHWTMEQTDQYAGRHHHADFFAVLNMIYSDYYNPKFDTATYVELANDWLDDADVHEGKTLKYYMRVVKD
jgi:hypothetical protein